MRFASFQFQHQSLLGIVSEDGQSVSPLKLDAALARTGVLAVLDLVASGRSLPECGGPIPISNVVLAAPIPQPRRNLFCIGRNYRAHAKELSATVFKDNHRNAEGWPIVFSKFAHSVVGPFAEVWLPGGISTSIDYEAELAVVIGRGGRNISVADAMQHVFGYTIVNDVTARDVQMRHQQWDLGKSFDTFCPMGPWVVTADAFDATDARVRCWVNDELRQDGRTSDLIFDLPTLIETCSRGITLFPGDIIATGTPAGVGMGMTPPSYLRHDDLVRIGIEGLGMIQNRFVDESGIGRA